MEAFVGLILVVLVIAFLIFFKDMIKKTGKYTEDVVTTNVNEAQIDLIKRSATAYNNLIEEVGEDFMTVQEAYDKMMKRKKKEPVEQPKRKR